MTGVVPSSRTQVELRRASTQVAILTMVRPDVLNALSWQMVEELHGALAEIREDPDLRVVILTGSGRGFCSGMDIRGADAVGTADGAITVFGRQERLADLVLALEALPQPVIAAVNGPAAGGGLALALACDLRICAPEARFNVAFVRIGLSGCDMGVSYFLPRLVGPGTAAELMLTGRIIDAREAARIGLVNRVEEGDLLKAADELAAEISRNSPFAVRMTKQVARQNGAAGSLRSAIELENRTQVLATRTADMREALSSFIDRREPVFKGD